MEIIKNFGLDPKLFAAQIINFLVVLYLLRRFLYKPLLDLLETRRNAIAKGVEQAEEARILLEKAEEREKQLLKKAQEEAKRLLTEAKNQRVVLLKVTETMAKKQAEIILEEARAQIAFETKETEKKLSAHISELALLFLQKSLTGIFTEKEQALIVKNAVSKIKKETN